MSTNEPNAFDRGYTDAESDLALDRLMRDVERPTWAERLDAYERGLIEKGYSQAVAAAERRDMAAALGPLADMPLADISKCPTRREHFASMEHRRNTTDEWHDRARERQPDINDDRREARERGERWR